MVPLTPAWAIEGDSISKKKNLTNCVHNLYRENYIILSESSEKNPKWKKYTIFMDRKAEHYIDINSPQMDLLIQYYFKVPTEIFNETC